METNHETRNPYAAMTTRELLFTAAAAVRGGQAGVASRCTELLCQAPTDVLDADVEALLLTLVDSLWASGWQPSEVQRRGRLACANATGARLVNRAIAADHAARRSGTLHHRWVAQIESLDLPRVDGRPGWVRRWIVDEGCQRAEAVAAMIDVAATLSYLPAARPDPSAAGVRRSVQLTSSVNGKRSPAKPTLHSSASAICWPRPSRRRSSPRRWRSRPRHKS